jgi:protein gp37
MRGEEVDGSSTVTTWERGHKWEKLQESSGRIRPGTRSEDAPAYLAGVFNCYAEIVAARFSGPGRPYEGLAEFHVIDKGTPNERREARWTGEVRLIEKHLEDPLRWKKPEKIFVNSMSDLFHPGVKDEWLAQIFSVMARAPQHTYQILTKRPERMLAALHAASDPAVALSFENAYGQSWPPPNWWFGVSIEDQKTANHRLPILVRCPAAVLWVSYEPALGPVQFGEALGGAVNIARIDGIVVGGESGPRARPMHPKWARDVRDLCMALGIPFFFKQWGEFSPGAAVRGFSQWPDLSNHSVLVPAHPGREGFDSHQIMNRVGKHAAGAHLDGVEWKELPKC